MAQTPLMPKATAVWLVENTALTFDQIAEFCSLHPLEVKGIADGDVAQGIRGMDPIMSGELTRVELEAAEQNSEHTLKLNQTIVELPETTTKKQKKYTPLSRRQDRPAAIAWLVRNHSELKDSEVIRLVGTTKSTIESIRNRTHWNIGNIQPQDPVVLGPCSQIELDKLVLRASKRVEREAQKENKTLQSTADTPD
ncbi:MAG: cell cycle transcriptional regulator TrcR [Pseudomonadota bacterium]|nr:cell cycle transcriptional regulator TrcR [Pseudomonadota bacterium]